VLGTEYTGDRLFAVSVGINHFGHVYLNHLLLPLMSRDGRIVVTASSVHDPASPGGAQGQTATLGQLQGLERYGRDCAMMDGGPFNADKAYKDSKVRIHGCVTIARAAKALYSLRVSHNSFL
jgi:NAD(P)-dependent dehydrogenase (short-subunit alcohol dehydrogenase family)